MNCLTDYIGLKGCSQAVPGSGLYVNSLPGMSSEVFSKIANSDQATAKNLWRDVQNAAYQQLHTDVWRLFQNRYQIRSVARSINIGSAIDLSSQSGVADNYRGFGVDSDSGIDSDYTRSHLLGISVDSLQLFIPEIPDDPFELIIWDLDTKELLFDLTVNNEAYPINSGAWNTIPVNMVFASKRLGFGYDSNQIDSYNLNIPSSINKSLHSCMCDWYGFDCNTYKCPGRVFGLFTASTNDLSHTESDNNSFGLTATIGFVCSYENLICTNKMLFKDAWWYLLGWMTLEYELKGSAITNRNTVKKEDAKQDQDDLFKAYTDKLTIAVNGINLDTNDLCLECNGAVRKEFVQP